MGREALREKTARGVLWRFAQLLSQRGVNFLITLLLARVLLPRDFGLMAIVMVIATVATSVMDSGIREALIRKQNAAPTDLSTGFWANTALGLLAYGALCYAAPLLATFYNDPRITPLVRVAGLAIVFNSLSVVQLAVLARRLDFRAQLKASVPASLLSGLAALGMAYAGLGVWALIGQFVLAAALNTVFLWNLRNWHPSLLFSRQALRGLLDFGSRLFAVELLNSLFRNIFVIVIGRAFSSTVTGYFFFAQKIRDLLMSQLVLSIEAVTYPALATLQDDPVRLKAGYRRIIQVTTFAMFPLMLLVAALAQPLFELLLPQTWGPAARYLQLMCLEGILYPLHSMNLNILKVKGRSDLLLKLAVFRKVLVVAALLISIRYGVVGILISQLIVSVIAYAPNSYFTVQLIDYPPLEQLADVLPGLLLSAAVSSLAYLAGTYLHLAAATEVLLLGVVACALYLGGAHAFRVNAYLLAVALLKNRMQKVST